MAFNLITAEPKLLPVPVSFSVPDGYLLIGDINYTAQIAYTEHDQNFQETKNGTIPQTADTNINTEVDFGNVIIGGVFSCNLGLPVQEIATGNQSTYSLNVPADIIGTNPSKDDIKNVLGDLPLMVIAYKESRFNQFKADGTPVWGPPHGFGIMQVDPPDNEAQVFNWRENIAEGIRRYNQKKAVAENYGAKTRATYPDATDLNDDQIKVDTYQLYNGGHYYTWDDTNKIWQERATGTAYGNDAIRIEALVSGGNPPTDW